MTVFSISKKFLIISYAFPPMPSIGGRRWAKFAKYIKRKGGDVTVLAARHLPYDKSPWDTDIEQLSINRLPRRFPEILNKIPVTVFEKIKYRLWLLILKIVSMGSYYDHAILWKAQLTENIKDFLKNNLNPVIIVSAPPFRLLYYAALLRKNNTDFKLVADFRDTWTWGKEFGFPAFNKRRMDYERYMEKTVLSFADFITVPVKPMQNFLTDKYPEHAHKIIYLPHGFDTDDYSHVLRRKEREAGLRFIYGGTLYDGIGKMFNGLLLAVKKNINEKFTIDFYGHNKGYFESVRSANFSEKIRYHAPVSSKVLANEMVNSDYNLVMFPEFKKDHITTKFYEIIYTKVPIIYIGYPGLVSDFVSKEGLGIHILPDDVPTMMGKIFTREISIPSVPPFGGIQQFDYSHLTDKLIALVND